MRKVTMFLIDIYRSFSFLLYPGGACKFSPTCSKYTRDSISKYGFIKGVISGVRRLASCR